MMRAAVALLLVSCASAPVAKCSLHEEILRQHDRCEALLKCGDDCHEEAFACIHDEHVLVMAELDEANR